MFDLGYALTVLNHTLVQERDTMPSTFYTSYGAARVVSASDAVSYTFNTDSFNNWRKVVVLNT